MKRIFCFLLIFAVSAAMFGCSSGGHDDVIFYYSRNPSQYQYFEEDGVIHTEVRDMTGHRGDLRYMVGLYLAGPLDEGMTLPFTKSTRLLSAENQDNRISIELSDHTGSMTDSEFTLACACLTLTCLQFSSADSVTITSGERSVTMTSDNILLFDFLPAQEPDGG